MDLPTDPHQATNAKVPKTPASVIFSPKEQFRETNQEAMTDHFSNNLQVYYLL